METAIWMLSIAAFFLMLWLVIGLTERAAWKNSCDYLKDRKDELARGLDNANAEIQRLLRTIEKREDEVKAFAKEAKSARGEASDLRRQVDEWNDKARQFNARIEAAVTALAGPESAGTTPQA